MKPISILVFWLLGIATAAAESPKAELQMSALNSGQWPAEFRITLDVPPDHHAYLNAGDKNIYIPVSFDDEAQLAAAGLTLSKIVKPVVNKAYCFNQDFAILITLQINCWKISAAQVGIID